MGFITENFMLHNDTARVLYRDFAKDMPIIDYHCHLDPKQIAENHQFADAYEVFLGGDHYKWRQMRSGGIDEELITGKAAGYNKFLAFAKIMPLLIGNPLYHWTHLELLRYFDIEEPLSESTCPAIWERCNALLATEEYRAQELIRRSNVAVICTTDDPADSLIYHQQLRGFSTKILPTFRPDKAVEIGKATFIPYMQAAGIRDYTHLMQWLTERIDYFAQHGCRLSDHAMEVVPFAIGDPAAVWEKRMNGGTLTSEEEAVFKTAVMKHCAAAYAERGWTMQIHIGAMRNNNTRMFRALGPDTGFDSLNDLAIAEPLSRFLDNLEYDDCLPRTILYNLNPKDNYTLASMLGNFQKAPVPGKIQFGSGWWFNDQRDGMEAQLKALANLGILGHFVGMLTDSRSFLSYPRHEYFRRILCNLLGTWVEQGEYPRDMEALGTIVRGICYENANRYFGF